MTSGRSRGDYRKNINDIIRPHVSNGYGGHYYLGSRKVKQSYVLLSAFL